MPNNYEYAESRFLKFEKQMENNNKLKEAVHNTINDYIKKDYIREVDCNQDGEGWYLPIFANITVVCGAMNKVSRHPTINRDRRVVITTLLRQKSDQFGTPPHPL